MVHDEINVANRAANSQKFVSARNIIASTSRDQKNPTEWRNNITATVFWVGEDACEANPVHNYASSWDVNWMKSYGGVDCPINRVGLRPKKFQPKMNPFYIALPYNDIARNGSSHKEEAPKVISWYHEEYKSKFESVCKGKWIAIKHGNKICYAQWEDCGPFYTNDYEYVFLGKQPKKNRNNNAGIDLSPAVRDFLGVRSGQKVSWKFVDDLDVQSGPWAKWLPYQGILSKYP
ncbi:MAG: hypothetical protein ACSHX6_10535 [Akkermansiaceae bacterium]